MRFSKSPSLVQNSLFDKEGIKGRFYQARNILFVAFADSSALTAGHCPVEVQGANLKFQNAGISQYLPAK
jgi:hypothetical protein